MGFLNKAIKMSILKGDFQMGNLNWDLNGEYKWGF